MNKLGASFISVHPVVGDLHFWLKGEDHKHGVTEIGLGFHDESFRRTTGATEAVYLFIRYVFDTLGYRRLEWNCPSNHDKSKQAALRFGFKYEGVMRLYKSPLGVNEDWEMYSMLESDWPLCKKAFEEWLDPKNFDEAGKQIKRLAYIRTIIGLKDE